jgi:hypothetical protein
MTAEVLIEDVWQPVPQGTSLSQDPDPAIPCQMIDFLLPEPIQASGIRVIASLSPDVVWREISIVELDALSAAGP